MLDSLVRVSRRVGWRISPEFHTFSSYDLHPQVTPFNHLNDIGYRALLLRRPLSLLWAPNPKISSLIAVEWVLESRWIYEFMLWLFLQFEWNFVQLWWQCWWAAELAWSCESSARPWPPLFRGEPREHNVPEKFETRPAIATAWLPILSPTRRKPSSPVLHRVSEVGNYDMITAAGNNIGGKPKCKRT